MDIFGKLIEYLEMMYGGPIPPMLLTWGAIFLFMAAGGKLIGMKATGWRRWAILLIGLIFLLAGLRVYIRPLPVSSPIDSAASTPTAIVTEATTPVAPAAGTATRQGTTPQTGAGEAVP